MLFCHLIPTSKFGRMGCGAQEVSQAWHIARIMAGVNTPGPLEELRLSSSMLVYRGMVTLSWTQELRVLGRTCSIWSSPRDFLMLTAH